MFYEEYLFVCPASNLTPSPWQPSQSLTERRLHCSPQQPTQACLTPASVSPRSLLRLTCLPFQYVILDVDVAVKGLILFGFWWHEKHTTQITFEGLLWQVVFRFSVFFPGIIRKHKHANRNQVQVGNVPSFSQIISNRIIYCSRLYPYALCVALLFTYIIFIYFCMLIYIFGLVFTFHVASCSIPELAFCSQIFLIYIIPWTSLS